VGGATGTSAAAAGAGASLTGSHRTGASGWTTVSTGESDTPDLTAAAPLFRRPGGLQLRSASARAALSASISARVCPQSTHCVTPADSACQQKLQ
jgi:hypothetical protein